MYFFFSKPIIFGEFFNQKIKILMKILNSLPNRDDYKMSEKFCPKPNFKTKHMDHSRVSQSGVWKFRQLGNRRKWIWVRLEEREGTGSP